MNLNAIVIFERGPIVQVLFIVCLVIEFIFLFSDEVLNPKPEMSEDHSRMTRRAMMSTNVYGRSSEMRMQAQVQNIVVLSSAPQLYARQSRFAKSSRRTKQSRMVHTDYTRGSDSEDSD